MVPNFVQCNSGFDCRRTLGQLSPISLDTSGHKGTACGFFSKYSTAVHDRVKQLSDSAFVSCPNVETVAEWIAWAWRMWGQTCSFLRYCDGSVFSRFLKVTSR